MSEAIGKVYLVGAGPGDPGLLTLRGKECLTLADVVVYDYLANPELLVHAPTAEHIYVGKQKSNHTLPQDEINRLMVEKAQEGKCVVRLKGGDPFMFGRGGEEALALQANGVPFEAVPGVTAGIAAPAYAGMPVTHRGMSRSITLITGHHSREGGQQGLNLAGIAREGTLAFYMGVTNLPAIVEELLEAGRPATTPAAMIEWGTFPKQRTVTGTLESIEDDVRAANLGPPAIFVVGEIVGLGESLAWFQGGTLRGGG